MKVNFLNKFHTYVSLRFVQYIISVMFTGIQSRDDALIKVTYVSYLGVSHDTLIQCTHGCVTETLEIETNCVGGVPRQAFLHTKMQVV